MPIHHYFHQTLSSRLCSVELLPPVPSKNTNFIWELLYDSKFYLFLYVFLRLSCEEADVTTDLEDTQTAADVLHFRRHLLTLKIESCVFTAPVSKPSFHLEGIPNKRMEFIA